MYLNQGIDSVDNSTHSGHSHPRGQVKYEGDDVFAEMVCVFSFWLTKSSHFGPCCLYLIPSFIKLSSAVPLLQSSLCAHFVSSIPSLEQLCLSIDLQWFSGMSLFYLSFSFRVTAQTSLCS